MARGGGDRIFDPPGARGPNVAASTQNQALSALLFLYKEVLKEEIGWLGDVERATKPERLPVVLTGTKSTRFCRICTARPRLMAGLLYGSGLRLMECVRLRVKDLDFGYARIMVRDGKGAKDRVTMLPVNLAAGLERHLQKVKAQHEEDLEDRRWRASICRTLWRENIQTRRGNGPGNGFFLRRGSRKIRGQKRAMCSGNGDIILKRVRRNWQLRKPCAGPGSTNRLLVTRCGILSPRICSRTAMTFAPSRNYSGTRMFRRP